MNKPNRVANVKQRRSAREAQFATRQAFKQQRKIGGHDFYHIQKYLPVASKAS
jgi:hypothetical protein